LRHVAALSSGPIADKLVDRDDPHTRVLASVTNGSAERPYVVERSAPGGRGTGRLLWTRGSSIFDTAPYNEHGLRTPAPFRGSAFADPSAALIMVLRTLGYDFSFTTTERGTQGAVQTIHRSANALWFNAYLADTTVGVRYRLPAGMPLLTHSECTVSDGVATYHFGTTVHSECRFLVNQTARGTLVCRELAPFPHGTARLLEARGFVDATVTVLLPPVRGDVWALLSGEHVDLPDATDNAMVFTGVSGNLRIG